MINSKVAAIGLNPVMQKTIFLDHLWENEVNRSGEYYLDVAGKGANTARVLTQLGAETIHLTHAGGAWASLFREKLAEDKVPLRFIDSESEIRFCYTLINREKNTMTEIVEEARPVGKKSDKLMREAFLNVLDEVDIITISGTKAAGYSDDIVPWMVRKGTDAGKMIILDIKGKDLLQSIPWKPFIITPNMKEFAETFVAEKEVKEHGNDSSLIDAVKKQMQSLYREHGIITVLTRGKEGVLFCCNGEVLEKEVIPLTPVNSIGSGDSFTAGLAFGASCRLPLSESLDIAVDCGRRNALQIKPGSIH